jgi:tetratricopeptide (TPR) repeat protein
MGSSSFRHPINQAIALAILIALGWGLNSVEIEPKDATGWYDLACCYALPANIDSALRYLKKAIEIEPATLKNSARTDPDFASLHEHKIFKNLIA